jgi:hypothetical protein
MSNKLFNSFIAATTFFVSQQGFAQTCYYDSNRDVPGQDPTAPGHVQGSPSDPTGENRAPGRDVLGPATCVAINVVEQIGTNVDLEVSANRLGEDISNFIKWYSDVDGVLGSGSILSTQLSEGVHKITAVTHIPHLLEYLDVLTISVVDEESNCHEESASISETFDEYHSLHFVNNAVEPVNIYWLRYTDAERVLYKTLAQNEIVSLNGYPGHKWVVTDENNLCRSVHSSGYEVQTIELN